MTKTYHLVAVPDDQQLFELLRRLNELAVEYDAYEYGLPTQNREAREEMMEAVLQWLGMLENLRS